MKTLYIDLVIGAAGDMILASLIDLGVPLDYLNSQLSRLGIEGVSLDAPVIKNHGMCGRRVVVNEGTQTVYRHLPDIMSILERGGFARNVVDRCNKVLMRIAEAEAAVHGVSLDHVHFHEIGAVDTIVDILGTVLCLDYLKIDRLVFSDLVTGRGTITTAHGTMAVPAPATARMMPGFRVKTIDVDGETLTPTGCAILTALGTQVTTMPRGMVSGIGQGCGTKEFHGWPNQLRSFLIEESADASGHDQVVVLESDMDHLTGEIMAYVAEQLMTAGALDVSWTPIYMKKGRPGYRLFVMCPNEKRGELIDLIISESRTLGVRYLRYDRVTALRRASTTILLGQEVAEKECTYQGFTFKKIEYEALSALARERKRPILEIAEEYLRAQSRSNGQ